MATPVALALVAACTSTSTLDPLGHHGESTSLPPALPAEVSHPVDGFSGVVLDGDQHPVPGAIVRFQATDVATTTDNDGAFELPGNGVDELVSITAWAEGFYISNAIVAEGQPGIVIELHRFEQTDNADYDWLTSVDGPEGPGCAECHSAEATDLEYPLPVDEWLVDAHAQSAVNPRFLTTYAGTDMYGNRSPDTVFIPSFTSRHNEAGYQYVALPHDPNQPYYGPGYQVDYPNSAGNCANCHVPGSAARPNQAYAVDVTEVEGVEQQGIFCDFCHKIYDVRLDETTKLPDPDLPGAMSYVFMRPAEGHQFFAGPYDDVAPGEDTYAAVQTESAFCAACHFGVFWGQRVYDSYGEWLASPYSDPEEGRTCQDCHMPSTGASLIATPEAGAHDRDPATVFGHRMPGALDADLLSDAVTLEIEADRAQDEIGVRVVITNDNTGHHIPTDYPGRQLLLVVEAFDEAGDRLEQTAGPVLPDWCGTGDPNDGSFAGLAGEAYAKVLRETWTGYWPTVAYWNPFEVIADTRIPAFGTASSEYTFQAAHPGPVRLSIRLLLRRSFAELMEWKDWDTPDMLVAEAATLLE